MSIESSDETAQAEDSSATDPSLGEPSHATGDASGVIETARTPVHDSAPPMSRKLAPPPKPKRDSGHVSSPPSARPAGEAPDLLSSSALKAPGTPLISFSGELLSEALPEAPEPPAIPSLGVSGVPQSVPPPIPPRRRSNPALSEDTLDAARPGSDPELAAAKGVSSPPRPITAPPRPRSEPPPPPASVGPESAPASSVPPSSSAIFAMRIIAVGESQRPPAVAPEQPEVPSDAFVPSASRLGTGRRSSRPVMATITNEGPGPAPVPVMPPPAPLPRAMMPSMSVDVEFPPDMLNPIVLPPPPSAEVPIEVAAPEPAAEIAPAELAPPAPLAADVPEEIADVELAPDSGEKKVSSEDAEELGRDDAISMPPEEVAALQAEIQAKAEAVKPPPPPKRAITIPGGGSAESAPPPVPPAAPNPPAPPTPDLAAAKAAQRSKTRQPWWEDLFNEDFMRASSRVSEQHVKREVTFIEESLGVAAGGVVLDLGCGAGHHAVEFASRGYGVVGYDLSLYQLALAADVAQERNQKINFLQGDMREMAFEEMFDGVFCWNTSFGYFEEDKNLAVAQRVFKALRPGGMFLIDVINRDFAAASAPCTVWYEGDSCVCMDDMSVDYISSRLRVKRSIILDDGRTKESLFSLRLYSLHELGKLLHEVGFRVTEASGHPATPGVFFGPNSPRIIMLAQRP